MKAYAQLKNGLPINVDVQNAIDGLEYLGYDVVGFTLEDVLSGKMDFRAKSSPFVGSIDGMTHLFKNIGKYPEPIDFPDSIIESGLLFREIRTLPLNDAIDLFKSNAVPVFIKPVKTKLFDGVLISEESHLNYLRGFDNPMVIVCDKIDILSEHRAYVHENKLIYCCNYSGNFRINPDYNYIDLLISKYKNAPVSYTIDVAILNGPNKEFPLYKHNNPWYGSYTVFPDRIIHPRSTVVEFNDFWAIGSYGLYCVDYAKMLIDRYLEIVK